MSRAARRLRPSKATQPAPGIDALAKQVQRLTRTIEAQRTAPKRRRRLTLSEFLPEWRAAHITSSRRIRTREDYARWVNEYVEPRFGAVLLEDIDVQAVETWKLESLAEGYKLKTLEPWLVMLKSILSYAAKKRHIEEVPEFSTSAPDTEQPWLRGHELEQLVATCRDDIDLAILLLGGDAGLRHGEMAGLRLPSIEDGTIRVIEQRDRHNRIGPPKNGKPRRVPMTVRLAQVLERLRAGAADADGYVITVFGGQRPMSYMNIGQRFGRLVKRSGLKKRVVLHSLRHTFINELETKGVSAGLIMRLVGHSKLSTTQRYLHVDEDQLQSAIEALRR